MSHHLGHGGPDHSGHGGPDHSGHGGLDHSTDSLTTPTVDLGSSMSKNAGAHLHDMMQQGFHFGVKETLLFQWWATDDAWGMIVSCVVVFLMALSYEGLKFLRARLLTRSQQTRYSSVRTVNGVTGEPPSTPEDESVVTITSTCHLQQTSLYVLQLTLGYLLMLLFMYFNIWICLAVVLGASTGYFLFGWHTHPTQISVGDHCAA